MKKITQLLMVLGLFLTTSVFAGSADVFDYNSNKVQNELSSLDVVDAFVEANDMSYTDLVQTNLSMASELNYGQTGAFGIQMMEPPLGIPSMVWGACFNWAGIAFVYLMTEDTEETKKAAYGCVGGTVIFVGCYVVWVFLIFGGSVATGV